MDETMFEWRSNYFSPRKKVFYDEFLFNYIDSVVDIII
jgi:hypothetical protein